MLNLKTKPWTTNDLGTVLRSSIGLLFDNCKVGMHIFIAILVLL